MFILDAVKMIFQWQLGVDEIRLRRRQPRKCYK